MLLEFVMFANALHAENVTMVSDVVMFAVRIVIVQDVDFSWVKLLAMIIKQIKQSKLAASYATVKNIHLRFMKSATFNEHRNYLKGKVQLCIKSREKDHYWTYDYPA